MIIAGLPCIGKTTMGERYANVMDLSSTKFHYLVDDQLIDENLKGNENSLTVNPNWPENYINEIISKNNKYDIVFVLARDYILEKLNNLNIEYLIAVPEEGLKDDYISRAKNRCNDDNFIHGFEERYDKWRNMMISQPVPKIYLTKGEFIEDTLKRLKLYGG